MDEFLRGLIKSGEIEPHKARDWVEGLVKTSRDRSDAFISTVRGKVRKPFKGLGLTNVDDLAKKGGNATSSSSAVPRKPAGGATSPKKTAAGKAPAKKPLKAAGA